MTDYLQMDTAGDTMSCIIYTKQQLEDMLDNLSGRSKRAVGLRLDTDDALYKWTLPVPYKMNSSLFTGRFASAYNCALFLR